ncbi:MAG: polysulfide reductase NrfD [Acidobacteria bacterium]|nr:polysulfide reductase NrfD [Acidobacteriota bacterium]
MRSGSPLTFSFRLEPKPQTFWHVPHAVWFFAMGLGSALYLNRLLFGIELGQVLGLSLAHVLGLALVAVGGLILISDLGRPERFWRALMNPRHSWISVGAICDFLFLFLDSLYILPDLTLQGRQPLASFAWGDAWWSFVLHGIAAASAFIIIVYPGLVLSFSPSIPFWNTTLIPLQFLFFAFASALGMAVAFQAARGQAIPTTWLVGEALLLCVCLLLVVFHLINAYQVRGTARESARRLLRGQWAPHFLGGVFVAGLVLPLALVAVAANGDAVLMAAVSVGVLTQVGNFLSKFCVLKVGLYPPIF